MTPLKRLQAKGETSTLQTGKNTNKMWKFYHLYRINGNILWGNKKVWFQLYARACAHMNAALLEQKCDFQSAIAETRIRQKLLAFRAYKNNLKCSWRTGTSWAILLRKILSCELNSLKGVVCVSRSAFVWGDNNVGIFYKTSNALSTILLHIWLSDGSP